VKIEAIKVGVRHRRDLGDIDELAASIAKVGLLHPIVVTPDGDLIAGERRLAAYKQLGLDDIPVTVVPVKDIVRGEFAENSFRKNFTMSEAVAIKHALEPLERAAAKERMLAGKPSANFSEGMSGNALDKVAAVAGMHRTTLAKAEAIVAAAEAEPEKYGRLRADMDRSGRVNGPFKRLKNWQNAEKIRAEPPPLPCNGPYRSGSVDWPWPSEPDDPAPSQRGYWPYPTMSLDEIGSSLDLICGLMHEDAGFWFWSTNFHLPYAYQLLHARGLKTPTMLTWVKDRMGMGIWLRGQTEHAILAVRGKPTWDLTSETTALHAPVRGHSEKPKEFYDLVERLCPAPRYADLFSRRRHNDKWDCHGDEAPSATQIAAT
jgi:ParB/RepB/Spo0J family partition protein